MPRCRVVTPSTVRLPLSDGDWIDVYAELSAGQYLDLLTAMADRQGFAKILAYVLAWSFVGVDDKPLPYDVDTPEDVRRATVRSLDTATLHELIAALDRHEAAADAKRAKKKPHPDTSPASGAPLPSAAP